jgi:hypothetical protein
MTERSGMKETAAPTLSEHLLHEAGRFLLYPNRVYRTRSNLGAQEILDGFRRKLILWRKTFAHQPENEAFGTLTTPVLLDELYCRDLLRSVPEIVDRTRRMSNLTLSGIDPEPFVHLREAANCYILGLPQAAVALARAAIEAPLRASLAKLFGEKSVAFIDLKQLIDDYAKRGKLLSDDARAAAHRVRIAANEVLHQRPIEAPEALGVVEAARAVILEIGRRGGGTSNAPARPARPSGENRHAGHRG